jgi:hypothetical protein
MDIPCHSLTAETLAGSCGDFFDAISGTQRDVTSETLVASYGYSIDGFFWPQRDVSFRSSHAFASHTNKPQSYAFCQMCKRHDETRAVVQTILRHRYGSRSCDRYQIPCTSILLGAQLQSARELCAGYANQVHSNIRGHL